MEFIQNLSQGVTAAVSVAHLGWLLMGCLLGLLMGVVSGVGPLVVMALLLPMTAGMETLSSLMILLGVYCGSQYAAMNLRIFVPESGSALPAVMATDGYQLARQGHGGLALSTASIGSWVGSFGALVVLVILAPLLSQISSLFGVAERFSLMVLSLVGAVVLSPGSVSKSLAMIVLGILLSRVGGGEFVMGFDRLTGLKHTSREIPFEVLLVGIFVLAEVITYLGHANSRRQVATGAIGDLKPSRQDIDLVKPAVLRGTLLGTLMGLLPGRSAVLASLAAYRLEKNMTGESGMFGRGDLRGVVAPDAACQAGVQTSFLPMLTFGIPLNAVMALLVGVMILKGVPSSTGVMTSQPVLFWGMVTALGLAQVLMVGLNLPLRVVWTRLLVLPFRWVFPVLVVLACLGLYARGGSALDLYLASAIALVGYLFHRLACPVGPLLLGFVLGPLMESQLREALQTFGGWSVLVLQPISAALLLLSVVLLVLVMLPAVQRPRTALFGTAER